MHLTIPRPPETSCQAEMLQHDINLFRSHLPRSCGPSVDNTAYISFQHLKWVTNLALILDELLSFNSTVYRTVDTHGNSISNAPAYALRYGVATPALFEICKSSHSLALP